MYEQPPFWLQITNHYVIENFEPLLQYVKLYHFDESQDSDGADGLRESDFSRTYTHLKSVADDYAARIRALPMHTVPEFDIPVEKVMRIISAAILTARKTGVDDFDLLAALIHLIILNNKDLNAEAEANYFRIINHCISRTPILSLKFSWYTIEENSFMTGALEEKVANTEFVKRHLPKNNEPPYVYENRGALIKQGDSLMVTNINYQESKVRPLRPELATDLGLNVRTTTGTRKNSVSDLIELYPVIAGEFDKMRPSPVMQRKSYSPSESRMVRIVRVQGIKVEAETVDPRYEYQKGNVYLDREIIGVPNEAFLHALKPGDYLGVKGGGTTGLPFRIDWGWIGDVLTEFARDTRDAEDELVCMYLRDFGNNGTRWISEEGVLINLFDIYLNAAERTDIERARANGLKCRFRVHDYKHEGDKCIINGRFAGIDSEIPENTEMFIAQAHDNFVENLLSDARDERPGSTVTEETRPISPYLVRLLSIITYQLGFKLNGADTFARLEHLITAMIMLRMCGSNEESEYVRSQIDYQKAIIGFAQGKSPFELNLPPQDQLPDLLKNARMVDIIRNYHEATDPTVAAESSANSPVDPDRRTEEIVEKLIEASNALVDRIDESELNRIKKTICSHLGVSDVFRDICRSGTNYGVESEFLEFKASCVEPPAEWRTTSLDRNIEIQKWNILKAVCAFLNSLSGGELLIGVSDSGFALGLNDDLKTLKATHRIAEENVDRLRMYVKLFIDTAFSTYDGRVHGTAITAGRVEIKIETSDTNRDILRVKVAPYPWDVVKINLPDRPARFTDTYIRTSGASTPLDTSGVRETKLRKIKALDRDDYKTATILQAIDDKAIIEIHNYAGHKGVGDRRLEPFKLLSDFNAFLAYDLDRKDMRMFKLSRFRDTDIRITREHWRYEQNHADRDVDIFGMVAKSGFEGAHVTIALTDYSRSLIIDECALDATRSDELITPNNNPRNRKKYPWVMNVTVHSFAGIGRFIMGLPGHVEIMDTPDLEAYIDNARKNGI